MNKNLLIIGADVYGVIASEVAIDMGCFCKIDFVDDDRDYTPTGIKAVGKIKDICMLNKRYSHIVVAYDNPNTRLALLKKIEEETGYIIATLISPKAYISPSAQVLRGCIIEPLAVIQSMSVVSEGCIISAGAVLGYSSMCCDGVHLQANSTVTKSTIVPAGTVVKYGEVFDRNTVEIKDFFLYGSSCFNI